MWHLLCEEKVIENDHLFFQINHSYPVNLFLPLPLLDSFTLFLCLLFHLIHVWLCACLNSFCPLLLLQGLHCTHVLFPFSRSSHTFYNSFEPPLNILLTFLESLCLDTSSVSSFCCQNWLSYSNSSSSWAWPTWAPAFLSLLLWPPSMWKWPKFTSPNFSQSQIFVPVIFCNVRPMHIVLGTIGILLGPACTTVLISISISPDLIFLCIFSSFFWVLGSIQLHNPSSFQLVYLTC